MKNKLNSPNFFRQIGKLSFNGRGLFVNPYVGKSTVDVTDLKTVPKLVKNISKAGNGRHNEKVWFSPIMVQYGTDKQAFEPPAFITSEGFSSGTFGSLLLDPLKTDGRIFFSKKLNSITGGFVPEESINFRPFGSRIYDENGNIDNNQYSGMIIRLALRGLPKMAQIADVVDDVERFNLLDSALPKVRIGDFQKVLGTDNKTKAIEFIKNNFNQEEGRVSSFATIFSGVIGSATSSDLTNLRRILDIKPEKVKKNGIETFQYMITYDKFSFGDIVDWSKYMDFKSPRGMPEAFLLNGLHSVGTAIFGPSSNGYGRQVLFNCQRDNDWIFQNSLQNFGEKFSESFDRLKLNSANLTKDMLLSQISIDFDSTFLRINTRMEALTPEAFADKVDTLLRYINLYSRYSVARESQIKINNDSFFLRFHTLVIAFALEKTLSVNMPSSNRVDWEKKCSKIKHVKEVYKKLKKLGIGKFSWEDDFPVLNNVINYK